MPDVGPNISYSATVQYQEEYQYDPNAKANEVPFQPPLPNNVPRDFAQAFAGGNIKEINQRSMIGDAPRPGTKTNTKLSLGSGALPTAPKPSQIQRRKHQLTALVYEAQQKELELLERGSASRKTKQVTRGKYGW